MKTHPTFGNVVVTEHAVTVELTLRTVRDGQPVAIFTYAEIAKFAGLLAQIQAPAPEADDIGDMLA
ncbi:hypothetical protein VQ042_11670 [Aurantimonas sp. A2-1-M11]|uniref:hypothetical protein n=1 Tax=Aurantimonas sp. A2-1-M11 TaxID=3113712 RepID=UPI002F9427C8